MEVKFQYKGEGRDFVPNQVRGGKLRCAKFCRSPWILCGKFRGHTQNCCGVQGFAGSVELSCRCHSQCWKDPSAKLYQ